jgi:hypothetical protein
MRQLTTKIGKNDNKPREMKPRTFETLETSRYEAGIGAGQRSRVTGRVYGYVAPVSSGGLQVSSESHWQEVSTEN